MACVTWQLGWLIGLCCVRPSCCQGKISLSRRGCDTCLDSQETGKGVARLGDLVWLRVFLRLAYAVDWRGNSLFRFTVHSCSIYLLSMYYLFSLVYWKD